LRSGWLAERADLPRLILYERKTGFRPPQNPRPWECYVPFDRPESESLMDDSVWKKTIQPRINDWMRWGAAHRLPAGYEQPMAAALLLDGAVDRGAMDAVRSVLEQSYDRVLEADPARIVRTGPGGYEEDIVYWTSANSLPAHVEPRVRAMFRLSLAKRDGKDIAYLTSKRYRDFPVFVSHDLKPPDDVLVRRICVLLGKRNIAAFEYNDRNRAGIEWRPAMNESLRKTTHFVALVSPTYDQSPTCTEEVEAVLARGQAVEILPFKVLGRQSPHPRLTALHHERLRAEDPEVNAEEVVKNVIERLDAALQGK
jgi:hypothetical protein